MMADFDTDIGAAKALANQYKVKIMCHWLILSLISHLWYQSTRIICRLDHSKALIQ